jgi:glycosyltransferase involved in cell wall biosynthesis
MSKKLVFLMDLPNPVHGMSNINLAIKNKAIASNLSPKVINTVPSYAAKFFSTKWWGLFKILHTVFCYFKFILLSITNIKGVVYRPINGGSGQIYDLFYILICRIFLNKIYVHHHSFNYLNQRSGLFSVLNKLMGSKTKHVVLGQKMADDLAKLYDIKNNNIIVLSNLAFFNASNEYCTENKGPIKLGHLANLCVDKGVDVFVDVCEKLNELNVDFEAIIAGPFADQQSELLVLEAVGNHKNIQYIGSVYNEQKKEFYKNIDCFIFPSKYKNEAEPLVLFEAAESATLLIGSQRGCMKDVINSLAGFSFPEDNNLTNNIVKTITDTINNNGFELEAKKQRLEQFKNEHVKAIGFLKLLMDDMKQNELSKA